MGSGISGLYIGTHGSPLSIGSLDYMSSDDQFRIDIQKRKDIDPDDYLDIVAHGSSKSICIQHNGRTVTLSHNAFARLLKESDKLTKKKIRLLSCNTGSISRGFAQGLADRLNIEVLAPQGYVAVDKHGNYAAYKGHFATSNGRSILILDKKVDFITYYPHGGKNK